MKQKGLCMDLFSAVLIASMSILFFSSHRLKREVIINVNRRFFKTRELA